MGKLFEANQNKVAYLLIVKQSILSGSVPESVAPLMKQYGQAKIISMLDGLIRNDNVLSNAQ